MTDKKKIKELREALKGAILWAEMLDKDRTNQSSLVAHARQILKETK
jgi:hypothetical protein